MPRRWQDSSRPVAGHDLDFELQPGGSISVSILVAQSLYFYARVADVAVGLIIVMAIAIKPCHGVSRSHVVLPHCCLSSNIEHLSASFFQHSRF